MKKFFEDFKAFAMRGNVIDMAVGVIIGAAFGSITTSLVNDIFMPLIGVLTGGINFGGLFIARMTRNMQNAVRMKLMTFWMNRP